MVGYLGVECVIVQGLEIVFIDVECLVLVVKGVIFGVIGGDVIVCFMIKV